MVMGISQLLKDLCPGMSLSSKEDGVTHTATWPKFQISNFQTVFSLDQEKIVPKRSSIFEKDTVRYGR